MRAKAACSIGLLSFAGCLFAPVAGDDVVVRCAEDAHCPSDRTCVQERCLTPAQVSADDVAPVVFLDEGTVFVSDTTVSLAVRASERLSELSARADGLALSVVSESATQFRVDVAPGAPDGTYDLELSASDAVGNTSVEVFAGAIVVDSSPPEVQDVAVDEGRLQPGGILIARVTFSEPVRELGELEVAGITASGNAEGERGAIYVLPVAAAPGVYNAELSGVVDRAGNLAAPAFIADLVEIDGTDPRLTLTPDRVLYSEIAPFNEVRVAIDADETLAEDSVRATLGGAEMTCTSTECVGSIALQQVVDDSVILSVQAEDIAGNAGFVVLPLRVDVTPPSASVSFTIAGQPTLPGVRQDTAYLGSRATATVLMSEPVTAPPVPDELPFVLLEETGDTFVFELAFDDASVVSGSYAVRFSFDDLSGHSGGATAVTTLEVATNVVPAACPLVVDGEEQPTDFDGDGVPGVLAGCDGDICADCDDLNPLIYPGAPEIPGDRRANDCSAAGDLSLDESNFVFVRPGATGTGTREAPLGSLDDAAAAAGGRWIAVGSGQLSVGDLTITHSMIGGFDKDWRQSEEVTLVQVNNLDIVGDVILSDLTLSSTTCAMSGEQTFQRVRLSNLSECERFGGPHTFVAFDHLGPAGISAFQPTSFRAYASRFPIALGGGDVDVLRSEVAELLVIGGSGRVVSSRLEHTSPGGTAMKCAAIDCDTLELIGSDVIMRSGGFATGITLFAPVNEVRLLNTLFVYESFDSSVLLKSDIGTPATTWQHNAFPENVSTIFEAEGGIVVDNTQPGFDSLENCAFTNCSAADNNIRDAIFFDQGVVVPTFSPARGGAAPMDAWQTLGIPSSAAGDLLGECVPRVNPAIGADQNLP